MTSRLASDEQRTAAVVGIYAVVDEREAFWFNDGAAIQGVTHTPSFDTFGPFVVERQTLLDDVAVVNTRLRWRAVLDQGSITVGDFPSLIGNLNTLEDDLNRAAAEALGTASSDYRGFSVESMLRPILLEAERSLTVTRSGVLMLSIQLSILAGVALMFIAGLLVESRRVETDLLRSRGATNRQILAMSLMEGGLLTVPAALAAPWLAVLGLSLLDHVGPLAAIGLDLDPSPGPTAYLLAFLAAAGCAAVLATPAYRSARSFSDSYASRGRQQARSRLQTRGFDVALLAIAVFGFWQLSVHRSTVTSGIRGRFGVDPLLVGAPAIGLAAGAIFALRVIPVLAGAADAATRRLRSAVPALSAWQISRRPRRHARSALMLIMAIGIGLFSAAFTATWNRSQQDQADFDVGADLTFSSTPRSGQSLGDLHLRQAIMEIDSLESVMPVVRKSAGGTSGSIRRFMILDAATASEVAHIRPDLGPDFSDAMDLLVEARPSMAAVPLAGSPRRIGASFRIELEPLPEEFEPHDGAILCFCPSVRVVLQDADGFLHRIDLGELDAEIEGAPQWVEADLVARSVDGAEIVPRYPLSLVDVEIRSPTPLDFDRVATVAFQGVSVSDEPVGDSWVFATDDLGRRAWDLSHTTIASAFRQPSIVPALGDGDELTVLITTGVLFGQSPLPAFFSIRPSGEFVAGPLQIVTTRRLLDETNLEVGDGIRLRELNMARDSAEIVATITEFPTVDPAGGEAVLLDYPSFQMMNYAPGREIPSADEYWINAGDNPTEALAVALTQSPVGAAVVMDRNETADLRKTDPIALGTIGSLALGFVAAAVFAAVGFATSAAISARERASEFALLRAIGLSNRQLGLWLVLEQTALVVLSLGLGTLIGLMLSWVVLPQVMVTQAGIAPVPDTILVFPWTTVLVLDLVVVASLVAIVSLLVVLLRRRGVGTLLRLGIE